MGRSASTLANADHTVLSVGPYMFQSEAQRVSTCFARSAVQDSPPQRIFKRLLPCQPASRSIRRVLGVACKMLALLRSIRLANAQPSLTVSLGAMTTHAPHTRGRNISNTAISKVSVVTASIVSLASRPGRRCIDASILPPERCSISPTLGLPVEPEV